MTYFTSIPARSYPPTRTTVVEALRHGDAPARAQALATVASAYWRPLYATLRLRHRLDPADAEDVVQDFFSEAIAREWLAAFDPAKGRFRSFVRLCLDRHLARIRQAERRMKRGGNAGFLALDDEGLEARLAAAPEPDAGFDAEWARGVITTALLRFRAKAEGSGWAIRSRVFDAIEVTGAEAGDRPSYREVAEQLDLSVTQVNNYLHWARREFRSHVLDVLRELTADEAEFRAEVRALLGPGAA